jgi:L-lactate dehydrogenase complex protein LldE
MKNNSAISLFIPCLVDQIIPEIGIAMVKILRYLKYECIYDERQTCCGQPAFNTGNRKESLKVAGQFIDVFKDAEIVVAPSGSCVSMIRNYYPNLFSKHEKLSQAMQVSKKVFEFSEFLVKENLIDKINGSYSERIGFHNSCHSYRELQIIEQPIKILQRIDGCDFLQTKDEPICCGFGGAFSIKFAAISNTMAKTRLEMFDKLKIKTIVSNDPGCIMHMRQTANDLNSDISVLHLSEFLVLAMGL